MPQPFVTLIDSEEQLCDALVVPLSRISTAIIRPQQRVPDLLDHHIFIDSDDHCDDKIKEIVASFDSAEGGADKAIVPPTLVDKLPISRKRLLLLLDAKNATSVHPQHRDGVCGAFIKARYADMDANLIKSISECFSGLIIYFWIYDLDKQPSSEITHSLAQAGASVVIPLSQLTISDTTEDRINIADAFIRPLKLDTYPPLIPTIVSSYHCGRKPLGLVYSSPESIRESILTGKGVYQSRSRGRWVKGESSGATQDVCQIRVDCDWDTLEFSVVQHGSGFCHLDQISCFGPLDGLFSLERVLQDRLKNPVQGSYTTKLLDNPKMLAAKIMEEASELCEAGTSEAVCHEASDVLYFALLRCIANGVTLKDLEKTLDNRARIVTKRPGHAKPKWTSAVETMRLPPVASPPSVLQPVSDSSASIRMRTANLASITPKERGQLLRRPVLRSDEMIAKVRPLVDDVRARGDDALLQLTAKFDKAQLDTPLLFPPFYSPSSTAEAQQLNPAVKNAIDVAYANVHKFHAAQLDRQTLVVETMPGVVCKREARAVARVGLYVPGGTAKLPSTAIMLGVPAQVAGCEQIVIATPPRPDGSISPEILYVAHLVGAHAILRAGGGQAIAALAYGTQTCPKVDKIFGPGNQWVTAAKMLVQNDTEALVSIDMPAGPSEVLVSDTLYYRTRCPRIDMRCVGTAFVVLARKNNERGTQVIADEESNPAFVAADLLSQAEHGVDSQVVLVAISLSDPKLAQVEEEVDRQARALPRVDIVRESISRSLIVKTDSAEEALRFSNEYAPEHLIIHLRDAASWSSHVKNAGSVFLGPYTPERCVILGV